MPPTDDQLHLLALCRIPDMKWHVVARQAQRPGGLEKLLEGQVTETSEEAAVARTALRASTGLKALSSHLAEVTEMTQATADGVRLVTVLDPEYPANLRLIFNLPPFLFVKGTLEAEDALSVAVVGTRQASAKGLEQAERMASLLSGMGVTVLSGLAKGIDTAAHEATLAVGGRTIAVMGTGINRVYPSENQQLSERIAMQGALVSQFWPDQAPTKYTFPRRNVVTSGLGQGTVVIEASATSGAKMQARLAVDHGKQVFLISSLVSHYSWARSYLKRGAVEVSDPEEIVKLLRPPDVVAARSRQIHQDALALD